jgi:hypothetical protein
MKPLPHRWICRTSEGPFAFNLDRLTIGCPSRLTA